MTASIDELMTAIRPWLVSVTGLDEHDGVRRGYSDPHAAFLTDKTYCYYNLYPDDAGINRQTDVEYQISGNHDIKVIASYNRVLRLQLIFYGSGAADIAQRVRLMALKESTQIKELGLHVIPDIPEPPLFYEMYQNKWFQRSDLVIRYNQLVVSNLTGDDDRLIEAADVNVLTEQTDRIIDIEG